MGKRKQGKLLRTIISLIKDKTSLLLLRATSLVHVTVLLATSRSPPSPPSSHRLASVLISGTAAASAIVHRLRRTSSCHVALKCLIVIRHIIAHDNDRFGFYPVTGGRNFLNLSHFRDGADSETWELSNWVRFYSCYLEANLIASRKLGVCVSGSDSTNKITDCEIGSANLSNRELMTEMEVLVGLIEEICKAPSSGFDHKSSLIHEILKLTSEDYSNIQRLVVSRLGEFRHRVGELGRAELDELAGLARRVEGCRERMSEVFGNRKRNDAFWEYVEKSAGVLTRFGGRVGEWSERVSADRVNVVVVPAVT